MEKKKENKGQSDQQHRKPQRGKTDQDIKLSVESDNQEVSLFLDINSESNCRVVRKEIQLIEWQSKYDLGVEETSVRLFETLVNKRKRMRQGYGYSGNRL